MVYLNYLASGKDKAEVMHSGLTIRLNMNKEMRDSVIIPMVISMCTQCASAGIAKKVIKMCGNGKKNALFCSKTLSKAP